MKPRVYLETTIPSYLTAWPSRDLIRAAHQQLTREWWATRGAFELYASRLVIQECRAGDPKAAADRLPHRHRDGPRRRLLADMELHPHSQPDAAITD